MDEQRHDCIEKVWRGHRVSRCSNPGKHERDGKWYCSTHVPENVQARQDARITRHLEEMAQLRQQSHITACRKMVVERAVEWYRAHEKDGGTADALALAVAQLLEACDSPAEHPTPAGRI